MPKITLLAEQPVVFSREIDVTDEQLAQIQVRIRAGDQAELHEVGAHYLDAENIVADGGYQAVRVRIH